MSSTESKFEYRKLSDINTRTVVTPSSSSSTLSSTSLIEQPIERSLVYHIIRLLVYPFIPNIPPYNLSNYPKQFNQFEELKLRRLFWDELFRIGYRLEDAILTLNQFDSAPPNQRNDLFNHVFGYDN